MSQTQCKLFPSEEIKPNRWTSLKETREFINFLVSIGLKPLVDDGKLEWCASVVEKYHCSHDPTHSTHVKYQLCGKRGLCPRCSMCYSYKRAGIMYAWLKNNLALNLDFDLKMNQIVLTLPEELHSMDKKVFAKMVKVFMKRMGIESYGYCIQDRHSKDPLSGKYVHAHILSLNMREHDGKLVRNDYYFDTELMRTVWKNIVKEFTDIQIEGRVNLHAEYHSILRDPNKCVHLLAYCYRYPIQDLFNVQIRYQSMNYVHDAQIENFEQLNDILQLKVFELTQDVKPRLVWCGLISPARRKHLIELIGIPKDFWKNLDFWQNRIDERAKLCRDCGNYLDDKPFDVTEYDGDNEPS